MFSENPDPNKVTIEVNSGCKAVPIDNLIQEGQKAWERQFRANYLYRQRGYFSIKV